MKWLFVYLTFLLFESTKGAPFVPRQKFSDPTMQRTLSIRGGDLGPIKSKTLANIFSGLAACDGVGGIFAPISSMKMFCGVDVEKGSLSEHYLHGVGASAASVAISTYLATSETTSVDEAIGYGFLVRLASMTFMILTNKYHELGMNNSMFLSMWLVLAATTYALFTEQWEYKALTQAVSLLLAFHGAFLFLKPEKFLKRTVGNQGKSAKKDVDVVQSKEQQTKDMASVDGGYMMMSGVVTALLVSGVDPANVAGIASALFVPVFIKLTDLVKLDDLFGIPLGVCAVLVLTLMAVITAGTIGSVPE